MIRRENIDPKILWASRKAGFSYHKKGFTKEGIAHKIHNFMWILTERMAESFANIFKTKRISPLHFVDDIAIKYFRKKSRKGDDLKNNLYSKTIITVIMGAVFFLIGVFVVYILIKVLISILNSFVKSFFSLFS